MVRLLLTLLQGSALSEMRIQIRCDPGCYGEESKAVDILSASESTQVFRGWWCCRRL